MYRCPFCHSTNIEQERDYNELKIELKEIMKENEKDMPLELKQILNEAIVYDLYNDEQYLKNLELHGMTLFCNDCGYIFKEYDVVDDANFIPPTEISKEEFEQVILDALHKQRRTIIELDTEEKEKSTPVNDVIISNVTVETYGVDYGKPDTLETWNYYDWVYKTYGINLKQYQQ